VSDSNQDRDLFSFCKSSNLRESLACFISSEGFRDIITATAKTAIRATTTRSSTRVKDLLDLIFIDLIIKKSIIWSRQRFKHLY